MSDQNTFEPSVQMIVGIPIEQFADGHLAVHTDDPVETAPAQKPGETLVTKFPDGHVLISTDRHVEVKAPRRAHVVEYGSETERDELKARFGKAVMNDLPEDHRLMIAMTNAEVTELEGARHHVQKVRWHGVTCS